MIGQIIVPRDILNEIRNTAIHSRGHWETVVDRLKIYNHLSDDESAIRALDILKYSRPEVEFDT